MTRGALLLLMLATVACPSPDPIDDDDNPSDDDDLAPDDDDDDDDDDSAPLDDDDATDDDDDDDATDDDDDATDDDDDATPFECIDDAWEPNDDSGSPVFVGWPFNASGLSICPGDAGDWYLLPALQVSGLVEVDLVSEALGGNVDVELIDPDGAVAATSTNPGPIDSIVHYVNVGGDWLLHLWEEDPGVVPGSIYNLQVQVGLAPTTCEPDAFEPNDSAAAAAPLAATTYVGLTACNPEADWYSIEAQAGDALVVDVQFNAAEGNLDATLYDPSGAVVATATSGDDDELISYSVPTDGDYVLALELVEEAGYIPGLIYDLTVAGATQGCVDDVFEPNNSGFDSAWVPNGVYLAQSICPGDDDWYALDLTGGEEFTYDLGYLAAEGNLDVYLWDNNVTTLYASGTTAADNEHFVWDVTATGPYLLQITMTVDAGVMPGNVYDMDVSSVFVGVCPVDMFEPNEDPGSATWLPSLGSYPAMQVCEDEPDFFSFAASSDQDIEITVDFDASEGDVDVELYDPSGVLVQTASGPGAPEVINAVAGDAGNYSIGVIMTADLGVVDGINYDLLLSVLTP